MQIDFFLATNFIVIYVLIVLKRKTFYVRLLKFF